MAVNDIRIKAENYAYDQIELLRKAILGELGDADDFSGTSGQQLRSDVQDLIESSFKQITQGAKAYLIDAWNSGIDRASKEFVRKVPNIPGTSLRTDIDDTFAVVQAADDATEAQLTKSVTTVLSRASLARSGADDVLAQFRDSSSSGLFDKAKQQLAGTFSEEVSVTEAHAHDKRANEIQSFIDLQKKAGTISKTKQNGSKLIPVTVRIWKHKPLDMVGEPRPGHVAMHGKGVVFDSKQKDIPFQLMGADGVLYKVLGPKLPPLPISETRHCGCIAIHRVIFVTQAKADELIAKSKSTGGFHDSLFSIS